jgi:glycosyltransferase involved in cell wall biosynthesis
MVNRSMTSLHPAAEPRNIVMLVPLFYPHIGGVERHVDGLTQALRERGYSVSVVTMKHETNLPDREERAGIVIHRMPYASRFQVWLWILRNMKTIRKADLVHCHDFVTFYKWYLPFRLLFPWIPAYVTFHGFDKNPTDPSTIRKRKLTAALSRGYICVGDYISKWYHTPCTNVTLGATDLRPTPGAIRRDDRLVLLGRLEPDTAPEGILKAAHILRERFGTNLEIDVCGDGTLRPSLEEYVTKHSLSVYFHGFVTDVAAYLTQAKFAIALGYLSMLEAMACGAVTLSYAPNPLRKDYWSLAGLANAALTVTTSPEDLASCIHHLLANREETSRLAEKGSDFAQAQTWDALAKRYLELYGVRI